MALSLPLCGPLASSCHVMNGRRHGGGLGLSRQGLLPCRVPLARSWILSVAVRASKDGASGGQAQPPYTDMLLQREYELWQRQSRMYDALQEQHEREQQRWAAERERWAQQEALLKQEVAELRAQLLYVLSRGPAGGVGGGSSSTAPGGGVFVPQQQRQVAGREPAALPLGMTGLSPAEQVQAVVEAVKAGSGVVGPQEAAASQQGAAAPSSSSAAAQAAEGAGLPRYAAELAAAVAAVDELDVLADDLDFGALADRLAARAPPAAPAAAQAPPPPPAAAAATAPPPQQQQQQEQPAAAVAAPAPTAAPAGPRPTLVTGSDDIYWMHQLHSSLVEAGYYPGEDDCEEFFFGESTLSAVLTLQACEGLPETGVVDEATWQVLAALAPGLASATGPLPESSAPGAAAQGAAPASPPAAEPSPSPTSSKPYQELFSLAVTEVVAAEEGGMRAVHEVTVTDSVQSVGAAGGALVEKVTVHEESRVEAAGSAEGAARTAWPVLMEGDGGRDVHAMHVALQQNGYYASDDDIRWWQFGDTTLAALKTFQACSGLPESGVCDPLTWKALLGADASPSDLVNLRSDDSADEEDLARTDRVWLMGEQRWEDRSRMKKK